MRNLSFRVPGRRVLASLRRLLRVSYLLYRLCGRLLLSCCFPALVIGLLVLALLGVRRVVGLLALLPPLCALDLAGVALDFGCRDQDAARDLLGVECATAHGVLHGRLG